MPQYCFKCDCGATTEEFRPMRDSRKAKACACGARMSRDFVAEGAGRSSGKLPDWVSSNAGVMPDQVKECNGMYAHLGVKFDPTTGDAHVPGKNRKRFLKERGLAELKEAPTRACGRTRYRVINGKVTQVA